MRNTVVLLQICVTTLHEQAVMFRKMSQQK